jgi:two-component system, OmpR family, response regulator
MEKRQPRLLLIEDDPDLAQLACTHLHNEGYHVEHANSGAHGLALCAQHTYDLIILDLVLPDMDGLEICRRIRAAAHYMPTIITSSKATETHRIIGLEIGADDYLPKPYALMELTARVRALLRRVAALSQASATPALLISRGRLRLDAAQHTAWLDDQLLSLTAREFDLLLFLANHPDQVFSRLQLLEHVWGYQYEGYEHTVNSHINRLRAKIETDPSQPTCIITVWGVGYKFTVPE